MDGDGGVACVLSLGQGAGFEGPTGGSWHPSTEKALLPIGALVEGDEACGVVEGVDWRWEVWEWVWVVVEGGCGFDGAPSGVEISAGGRGGGGGVFKADDVEAWRKKGSIGVALSVVDEGVGADQILGFKGVEIDDEEACVVGG